MKGDWHPPPSGLNNYWKNPVFLGLKYVIPYKIWTGQEKVLGLISTRQVKCVFYVPHTPTKYLLFRLGVVWSGCKMTRVLHTWRFIKIKLWRISQNQRRLSASIQEKFRMIFLTQRSRKMSLRHFGAINLKEIHQKGCRVSNSTPVTVETQNSTQEEPRRVVQN